jgi:hypothetical protein
MRGKAVFFACLALVLVAPAHARAATPPCATIVNSTPYEYPIVVKANGATVGRIKLAGGARREVCLAKPAVDPRLQIVVRSVWMAIGTCTIALRGRVEIVRAEVDGETITKVLCG